jgi:hypothetical protein
MKWFNSIILLHSIYSFIDHSYCLKHVLSNSVTGGSNPSIGTDVRMRKNFSVFSCLDTGLVIPPPQVIVPNALTFTI